MNKFDFMHDAELRAYVLSHHQATAAFHAYVDRMRQRSERG
jgi:hypothetical protein